MNRNSPLQPSPEYGRRSTLPGPRLLAGRMSPTPVAPGDGSDVDLFALFRILVRRRAWICACTATMLAAAALVCFLSTPRYRAVTQLQLLKQDMGGLSLSDVGGPAAGASGDALDFSLTLQTQVAGLKSDTLALQVIKELHLEDTSEFRYNPLIKSAEVRREMDIPFDQSPAKRAAALKRFRASLAINTVPGTRMITVGYLHPEPAMAAKIVDHLLADFVEHTFQVRYQATNQATDWLRKQLVDLRMEVERSQERAVQLQKSSGIFGTDEQHNIVTTRLEQLNSEVTTAETNRVLKEGIYRLASGGNPELVAGLLGASASAAAGTEVPNSQVLLNSLRHQEAELNAQYADAASKYGSEYPRLVQMKERLAALRSSISTELHKLVARSKGEYELAASRESAAKRAFAEQKRIASEMNNKAIDYTIAKQEADSNRELYNSLSRKLNEAGILAGLRSSELNVIDPATVPPRPSQPNIPLYLGFGSLAGLAVGVVCAFVADAADRTVRDPEELETLSEVPVLGVIPRAELKSSNGRRRLSKGDAQKVLTAGQDDGDGSLVSASNSPIAEAFRTLRTSLLLSSTGKPSQVFMITSGLPQEGKSFVASNLAAVFAQSGGKILLVDADLRRGTLSRDMKRRTGPGLSDVLRGIARGEAYRQVNEIAGLTFLPAGAHPDTPSELLGSRAMTALIRSWRQEYSYVLIDTPPVLPVTDAVALSPNVDGVLVVARFGVTNRQVIRRTIRVLRNAQVVDIGVLVNAMDVRSPEYYYYSGEYGYGGYGSGDKGEPPSGQNSVVGSKL